MTDNLSWDEYDDDTPNPGDLRDLVKKLQKELKTVKGSIEEKDKTIADLTGKVKATSLRDLLTAQGIDPKFAKRAELDGVDATEDAVKQWRQDNDGIYAFTPAEPAQEGEASEDEGAADEVPDDLRNGLQQGQDLEGAGRPSGSSTIADALRAARENPGQFKSEAEIDAYLRSLNAPTLTSLGAPDDQE